MKRVFALLLGIALASLLGACAETHAPPKPRPAASVGSSGESTSPKKKDETATNPQPAPAGHLPYGQPVPGMPGFYYTAPAPDKRYLDARTPPPVTEVLDPVTGKSYLVP
jgi:hypothetical protein